MSFRITVSYTVCVCPTPDPFFFRRTVGSTEPDRPPFFQPIEKTVHATPRGGTWSVDNELNVLVDDVNGGSGCLRFTSDTGGESFIAAFGFDQEKPWCDSVPNLAPTDTALTIHPQYYTQPDRIAARKAHRTSLTVTSSAGTRITVTFTDTHGHNLEANVNVG